MGKKKTITVFIENFWFSKLQKSTNRDFQHKFTDSSSCNIADIIYFGTFCVPSHFFFFVTVFLLLLLLFHSLSLNIFAIVDVKKFVSFFFLFL